MKSTDTVSDLINDADGPNYASDYLADDQDITEYLTELCQDRHKDRRDALMDCLRDDLEDKYGITFTMAAAANEYNSTAAYDLLHVILGLFRGRAKKMLEQEVSGELADREQYDPQEDEGWDNLAQEMRS